MITDPTIRASAEAMKALAETTGKALEQSEEYTKALARPFRTLVAHWNDNLEFRRWKNWLRISDEAQAIMDKRGVTGLTQEIPLKFGVRLLESASLEEDESLRSVWAKLLVNAGSETSATEAHTMYISILADLSAFNVKILHLLVAGHDHAIARGLPGQLATWKLPSEVIPYNETGDGNKPCLPAVGISLSNLGRQGLINPGGGWGGYVGFSIVNLSPLGMAFARACS